MRHAKSGDWFVLDPQRGLANNSVSYTEKPDMETFLREWTALVESKSGERGIFSRVALRSKQLRMVDESLTMSLVRILALRFLLTDLIQFL